LDILLEESNFLSVIDSKVIRLEF